MAMKTTGLDECTSYMERLGKNLPVVEERIFDTTSAISEKCWKEVITRRGHVDSKRMRDAVRGDKTTTLRSGGRKFRDTYPRGKDHGSKNHKRKTPIRNATKAFYIHYGYEKDGEKKMGDHFVDEVDKLIQERTDEPISELIDDFYKNQ